MTLTVDKMDEHGHIDSAHREHLPKKTKVTRYKRASGKTEYLIYKSEWANA